MSRLHPAIAELVKLIARQAVDDYLRDAGNKEKEEEVVKVEGG